MPCEFMILSVLLLKEIASKICIGILVALLFMVFYAGLNCFIDCDCNLIAFLKRLGFGGEKSINKYYHMADGEKLLPEMNEITLNTAREFIGIESSHSILIGEYGSNNLMKQTSLENTHCESIFHQFNIQLSYVTYSIPKAMCLGFGFTGITAVSSTTIDYHDFYSILINSLLFACLAFIGMAYFSVAAEYLRTREYVLTLDRLVISCRFMGDCEIQYIWLKDIKELIFETSINPSLFNVTVIFKVKHPTIIERLVNQKYRSVLFFENVNTRNVDMIKRVVKQMRLVRQVQKGHHITLFHKISDAPFKKFNALSDCTIVFQ